MARGGSKSAQASVPRTFSVDGIVTRAKNKTQQPGLPDDINEDGRPKVRRRNPEQMKEARQQQEAEVRQNKVETANAIKNAAAIEDRHRTEDQERGVLVNRRLEAAPAFKPPYKSHNLKEVDGNPQGMIQIIC